MDVVDSGGMDDTSDDLAMDDASDVTPADTNADAGITANGGTVDLLHFGVFGDCRPASTTSVYPSTIVQEVISGISAHNPQFIIATGDYMDGYDATALNPQVDQLLNLESAFAGHIFHSMGNHECLGATDSNCPMGTESANAMAFRTRIIPDEPALYYDFTVHTSLGDAHFIVTAPNAWSTPQQDWLTSALAQQAQYTFVVAHEGPNASPPLPPGSAPIETAIRARVGGVTLRLYGHTHEYRRVPYDTSGNGIVVGNAGAPLSTTGHFGFSVVDQNANGTITVTAYDVGTPPTVASTFNLSATGMSL